MGCLHAEMLDSFYLSPAILHEDVIDILKILINCSSHKVMDTRYKINTALKPHVFSSPYRSVISVLGPGGYIGGRVARGRRNEKYINKYLICKRMDRGTR
jgi:hypothetical protein